MANEPEEGLYPETEDEGGPVKSFLEHLEDLRWMLIKSASAAALGILVCLLAGNYVVAILMRPLEQARIRFPGVDHEVVTFTFGTNRLRTFNLSADEQELLGQAGSDVFSSFSAGDIVNLRLLVLKLKEPGAYSGWLERLESRFTGGGPAGDAELSRYLRTRLSPATENLLTNHAKGDSPELRQDLAADLNRIMVDGPLYETNRFARVKLSKPTVALLEEKPQGARLVRLNRELLLDAYPGLISPVRFAEARLVPVSVNSGTNLVPVFGFQFSTNADVSERAQRMNTSIFVMGPAKAFLVGFHVAIYAGIAIASPFIFYFLGSFVLPALKIRERRYLYRGLLFAIPLFMSGVCFCYFILMPAALAASQIYADWFGFSSNLWEAGDYIGFVCKFMLGMGIGFELPVIILVMVKIGILNYRILSKARPYMIVINLVLGAVLTTPEVFTQVLMAVPLQLLFEISVWIAWYWERQARKKAAAEGVATD